nr:serine hydrolase [Kibdelosporangium sp. MJ126-NF4]CEL21711.1 High-affnity carbon uptake protein Hat/HatR [Kibdelosporangium sp. MJ126-NF4]CTQ92492.1 High-affnity carbon uptake protein Hat/HatR [Kibdelosporangium sp. MJ126-NF4]
MLATAGNDNTARLWDITDPRNPNELATLTGHTSGLFGAIFSPDGTTLATSGGTSVRQILQHTSGITNELGKPVANPDGTYSLHEVVRAGLVNPPQFPPGTGWGTPTSTSWWRAC